MDPTYPLVPIVNFTACLLILVSVSPNALGAWNIGVRLYALWTFLLCVTIAISTILWHDNSNNIAPIWCDITTHIGVGAQVAIPACSLIITRRLYRVTRLRDLTISEKSRIEVMFEIGLGVGLPFIVMGVFYVVQEPRFVILEDFGCTAGVAAAAAGLEIVLFRSWSVLLPVLSIGLYSTRITWSLYHQHKEVNDLLDSNPSLNRSNFARIMILGSLDAFVTFPVSLVDLFSTTLQHPGTFWAGWKIVHSTWAPIALLTKVWTADRRLNFGIRWMEFLPAFLALVFFALFGLTVETRSRYKGLIWNISRPFGFKPRMKPELSNIVFRPIISDQAPTDVILGDSSSELLDYDKKGTPITAC